jgi:alpha-beta hydrolase superfamily lysophospholipase
MTPPAGREVLIARVSQALDVLLESRRVGRAPHDPRIAGALAECAARLARERPPRGVERYLEERPALARLEVSRDWHAGARPGELRLEYESTLFAPGRLRLREGPEGRGTLVFLHGSVGSAAEAFGERSGRSDVSALARDAGLGLACWDWPFHGERLRHGLYVGLRDPRSCEREYARLLPTLGTCLWREWVAELAFALEQIRRHVGPRTRLHVLGNSMGGAFAYAAPLLGVEIASATSVSSCARVADLLAEGATRVHGFFFYPLDGLRYFDLEDLVEGSLARGTRVLILHGDRDDGCREATRRRLRHCAGPGGAGVRIEVLPDHPHLFSDAIKARALAFLREVEPAPRAEPTR